MAGGGFTSVLNFRHWCSSIFTVCWESAFLHFQYLLKHYYRRSFNSLSPWNWDACPQNFYKDAQKLSSVVKFVNKHPSFKWTQLVETLIYNHVFKLWKCESTICEKYIYLWQNLRTLVFTHWAPEHSGPRVRLEGEGTVRKYLWLIIQRRGATSGQPLA